MGLGRSQLEQGPSKWADAEATLRAFLTSPAGSGGEASLVEVARQLLADVSQRRRQLHPTSIEHEL